MKNTRAPKIKKHTSGSGGSTKGGTPSTNAKVKAHSGRGSSGKTPPFKKHVKGARKR